MGHHIDSYLHPYQKEIKELIKQGYSIRTMVRLLNEKHPNLNCSRSNLHDYIQRMKEPNKFQQALSENAFDLPFVIKHGWLKTKEASIFIKNNAEVVSFDQMREDLIEELKEYSPSFKKIARKKISDPHCLIIDPSDIHVNKLATKEETGGEYNSEIAVQRVKEAVGGILTKAQGFPLEKIVLVCGNDILNVDGITNSTTSGTPQDVSNRWYEGFRIAKQMYVDVIEMLLPYADLEIIHVMSNHDYVSGWMLADTIYSWFRNCKNITWNISTNHRKYFQWGNNLLGFSHGDKFKADSAPLLMANEAPKEWSESYYRYFFLHHVHHHIKAKFQSGKDYQGVTVQHLRSPSPADRWHHEASFTHAKQAIEAFIHHKEDGQVCCITHNF